MSSRPEWRDLFLTAREHEISPLRFASVEMTELEAPVISTGAPIISTEVEVISTEELRHLDRRTASSRPEWRDLAFHPKRGIQLIGRWRFQHFSKTK